MADLNGARFFLNVPAKVAHDDRLHDKAKLLFGEIFAMLNVTGGFYMSNKELGKRLNCSPRRVRDMVNELRDTGYIQCRFEKDEAGSISKRWIELQPGVNFLGGMEEDFPGVGKQISPGGGSTLPQGGEEDCHIIDHLNRASNRSLNQIKGEVPKIDIFSLRPERSGK